MPATLQAWKPAMSSVAAALAGSTLTRRALVASVALVAPLLRSGVAAEPDPIFAAIKAAQAADAHLTDCLDGLNEDDDAAMCRANEAADLGNDATRALRSVTPTTDAGFHTLVRHYAADAALNDPNSVGSWCLDHLAASLPVSVS